MKGEKKFNEAWNNYFNFKFSMKDIGITFVDLIQAMVISLGVAVLLSQFISGKIAMGIAFYLIISFLEGDGKSFLLPLSKYTWGGRRRHNNLKKFRKAYWGYAMKNLDKESRKFAKSYLDKKGVEI